MSRPLGPRGIHQELRDLGVGGAAPQGGAQIELLRAEEAGADHAVGGDAQAAARAAEGRGHRRDEAHAPGRAVREAEGSCGPQRIVIVARDERVFFIKRPDAQGREEVVTAASAALQAEPGGERVALILTDGRRIASDGAGGYRILTFSKLNAEIPLAGAQALLRSRGGDERELTQRELLREAAKKNSIVPHETLLAEFYGRLARALFLPFLPLLAFPLGLAAKRGRRAAGLVVAGILLVAFQYALLLGQSLAANGKVLAFPAIWVPFAAFTGLAVWMFMGGRERLGDTPLTRFLHMIGDGADRIAKRLKVKFPKRRPA